MTAEPIRSDEVLAIVLFGISEREAKSLFLPTPYHPVPSCEVTPRMVADRIRRLVARKIGSPVSQIKTGTASADSRVVAVGELSLPVLAGVVPLPVAPIQGY